MGTLLEGHHAVVSSGAGDADDIHIYGKLQQSLLAARNDQEHRKIYASDWVDGLRFIAGAADELADGGGGDERGANDHPVRLHAEAPGERYNAG